MMQSTDRDMLTHALLRQQRGQPLGSPFAPAPVPQRAPLVAGNPTPPIAAPIPQYGFETGYRAAAGPAAAGTGKEDRLKQLLQMVMGVPGSAGSGAP
jgi:hypothetical protein